MDNPTFNSVSAGNSCEVNVHSLSSEKYIEQMQCAPSCMIETGKNMAVEVLGISSISRQGELLAQEDVSSPTGVLCNINHQQQSAGLNVSSDEDEMVNSKEITACQEFSESISVEAKLKNFRKCATFPGSMAVQLAVLPSREELPEQFPTRNGIAEQGQSSCAIGSSSYARSVSLPSRLEVVSAMRGTRAQKGASPIEKLHVKWAPEVFDPQVTSMSHTVQSRPQRPKVKKKDKHKNKGKSSRGTHSNEKKNASRKNIGNILDPRDMSLEATRNRLLNRYAKSAAEAYGSHGQVKCSSFLNEGLAKMHISTG